MMVSMVMPETGLRAVVAMALAATEVKKKEKSSVSTRPTDDDWPGDRELPEESSDGERAHDDAEEDRRSSAYRGRCVPARTPRRDGRLSARCRRIPPRLRSDLTMPKMPAVAIAPTPMKRT